MLKIAVVAPMPTASVSTVTVVKVGDRRMTRSAYAESCRSCETCSRGPVRSKPAIVSIQRRPRPNRPVRSRRCARNVCSISRP